MRQTRVGSLVESLANVAVGYAINNAAQFAEMFDIVGPYLIEGTSATQEGET